MQHLTTVTALSYSLPVRSIFVALSCGYILQEAINSPRQDIIAKRIEPVKSFWESLSEKACLDMLTVKIAEATEKAAKAAKLECRDQGQQELASKTYLHRSMESIISLRCELYFMQQFSPAQT